MKFDVIIEHASIGAGGIIGLLGVILGFLLNFLWQFFQRKSQNNAYKKALKEEVNFCARLANKYIEDNVKAPSYFLPLTAYKNSFPTLLENAALKAEEINAIQNFYVEVESLNKGIELAQKCWSSDSPSAGNKMKENYKRSKEKAERIKKDDGEYYKNLINVLK